MPLSPGEKLGPYEIVALLGRGGMGEVYRAHDPRLSRDVALKIVPEDLAGDPARMARFEREAKLLAALNHPQLGAIYGIENVNGRPFLVLEFIEGESLATRLDRGALPTAEALEICRQVALAIEAAHENGIVHRDLKPGNVMVRGDGAVKVVDFGLATSGAPADAGRPGSSQSPTLTQMGGGAVLGTAGYMSPEQARGRLVDRRTDIWAFGCVLFECLSGRRAFDGETTSDVIAKILEREPDYSALPGTTPPSIRRLITRCLEKDPSRRMRDAGDARLEIEEVLATRTSSGRIDPSALPAGPASRGSLQANRIVAGLIGAAVAALAFKMLGGPPRGAPSTAVMRLSAVAPGDLQIGRMVLTPDGKNVLLFGRPRSAPGQPTPTFHTYIRRLDERDVRALPGTERVGTFQVTPDNTAMVFRAPAGGGDGANRLWRVPLDGSSPAVAIGDWNPTWDGMMVLENGDVLAFAEKTTKLMRVSANGVAAPPMPITGAPPRTTLGFASRLPGDRGVLVNQVSYGSRGWGYSVGVLDPKTAKVKTLMDDGGNATYWPGGQLLFARGPALLAAPFDLNRLEVTGPPVGLASGLRTDFGFIPGEFQLASNGTLAVPPGGRARDQARLGFFSGGEFTPWLDEPRSYDQFPSFSRDGKHIAMLVVNGRGLDEIYTGTLEPPRLDRLIAAPADCAWPLFSGDGSSLAYSRSGGDSLDGVYIHSLTGASRDRRIFVPDSVGITRPWTWSPDGRWMLLQKNAASHLEILKIEVPPPGAPPAAPQPLFDHDVEAGQPTFSPDGRWVAYQSVETGTSEIVVCPFGADGTAGPPTQVTRGGGFFPRWGERAASLYYGTANSKVMHVSVSLGAAPTFGKPIVAADFDPGFTNWSLAPGDRMMCTRVGDVGAASDTRLDLVLNWDQELKQKLAEARKK
jgi:serine/threonine-protein kinase